MKSKKIYIKTFISAVEDKTKVSEGSVSGVTDFCGFLV